MLNESNFKREIIDTLENEPIFDWGVWNIGAPQVWSKTEGQGVKILLIDTGIDTYHKEFSLSYKGGYNFFERSSDVEDADGHGTHVAGLLTSRTLGVAPEAELHVVKVLNDYGKGTYASVMDGITYAMNYGFDIICMSLGVNGELPFMMQERIAQAHRKGIIMVSATGNNGSRKSHNPARMDEVIAVGGLDKDMKPATFTNGGYDVLAPAVDILSTYKNGKFARMSGTSMASPLVAGGIALLISYNRKMGRVLTPIEIKNMVKKNEIFDLTKLMD